MVTAFVAAPLYSRRRVEPSHEAPDRYEELVVALRDLEVDLKTGALDGPTYEAERARMEAEAADILRRREG